MQSLWQYLEEIIGSNLYVCSRQSRSQHLSGARITSGRAFGEKDDLTSSTVLTLFCGAVQAERHAAHPSFIKAGSVSRLGGIPN
jgi:hypothetical protein